MQKSRVRLSPHLVAQTQSSYPPPSYAGLLRLVGSIFLITALFLVVRHYYPGGQPTPNTLPQDEAVLGAENNQAKSSEYYLYEVADGDTLFSISKKFQIKWGEIVEMNDLREPYALERGQKIKLPTNTATKQQQFYENLKNKIYIVEEGDSFVGVAQKLNVSVTDLLRSNPELHAPDFLNVGQVLRLP
ncbi:MAG: LysM peptidoglycan-binding domain-containing protein [Patescibacteria group bacterium]